MAKGHDVVLNDEGQITDRRQLLSAGLNIVAKPKQNTRSTAPSKALPQRSTYQGGNSGQRAMRERQTRMLETQLEQAAKRAADEEMEEQRKLEHASKSRKTNSEISSARERYLQRKKEAEAAKAGGEQP
jgi:coiled-coil domain-containing protein 55